MVGVWSSRRAISEGHSAMKKTAATPRATASIHTRAQALVFDAGAPHGVGSRNAWVIAPLRTMTSAWLEGFPRVRGIAVRAMDDVERRASWSRL
jgi:hypothetical protein